MGTRVFSGVFGEVADDLMAERPGGIGQGGKFKTCLRK
jgi:hypothetical protein